MRKRAVPRVIDVAPAHQTVVLHDVLEPRRRIRTDFNAERPLPTDESKIGNRFAMLAKAAFLWYIIELTPHRKPHPPPVEIDNWPHPPIILETERPKPKRIRGVFVTLVSEWPPNDRLARGTYLLCTRAASNAMGFESDVGKLLRKNRGINQRAMPCFPTSGSFQQRRR